jgi:thioredoxin 1
MNTAHTLEELKNAIDTNELVVVDLYADWCSPCQQMLPVIEELAQENDVPFYKVNIDDVPDAKDFTGAKAIPMILIYKNGRKKEFAFGVTPKDKIQTKIDRTKRY